MKNLKLLTVTAMIVVSNIILSQNVGINETGNTADPSAGLDVDFNDKGLLIPRVALNQTTDAAPVTAPVNSLLVFNTANVNDVTQGYYYWYNGEWVRIGEGSGYWDRDAANGYLFPSTIADRVGIGTNTPLAKLDANHGVDDIAVRGEGEFGPTNGYLGIQGNNSFDGITTLNINGNEIGVLGISTGGSSNDNFGVYGHSNGWGGRFEYEDGSNFVNIGGNNYAIRIVDGTEETGKILTSVDNNGNAEWRKPGCGNHQEGFEGALGSWSGGNGDEQWETNSGGTGSTNTGPTAANEGTGYAYCETSGSAGGDTYILQAKMETCASPYITFDYHMYFNGNTDGTLNLDVSTDGGTSWTNLWNTTGDQGTAWQNNQNVNLGAYADQDIVLRFHFTVGTAGISYQYDCAIDDVNLYNVNVNSGSIASTDDDWARAGSNFVHTYYPDDSVLVGPTPGPTYPYEFAVDNGSASGTNIGIGSIEYFTDQASETTINNRFSPADDNSYALGATGSRWTEVFATNGVINTSDRRDKKNVTPLSYGLEEIMLLNPVTFEWNDDIVREDQKGKRKIGLIAQELQPIFPEVVKTQDLVKVSEDPVTEEVQEAKRWGVYYSDLIPVLVKGIQEQQDVIEDQNSKIESLESRIERLEALIENKE